MQTTVCIGVFCFVSHAMGFEGAEDRDAAKETLARYEAAVETAETESGRGIATLRLQIAQAQQAMTVKHRELNQRQRELEMDDPIARGIREKITAREKELLGLRRSLQSRLEAIPEIVELKQERGELTSEIQNLRARERALRAAAGAETAKTSTSTTSQESALNN